MLIQTTLVSRNHANWAQTDGGKKIRKIGFTAKSCRVELSFSSLQSSDEFQQETYTETLQDSLDSLCSQNSLSICT